MNMLKRSLAMLLVLSMLFSFVPFSVFADETVETTAATEEVEPLSDGPGNSEFGHSQGKGKDKHKDPQAETEATEVTEETVPETTEETVPETTEETVPETTEETVPETTEETVPETTEETVPETTEETVPETTEETVPETTEETVPETTVETIPEVTVPQKLMMAAAPAAETETNVASTDGVYTGTVEAPDKFLKVFHLDAGRKYFTVDQVKGILDILGEKGYSHMELAIGNDGLRFLLDDMSVTVGENTYGSATVTDGVKAGNAAYSHAGEWSEDDMEAIIAYAKTKGIEIIPLLNTPGHMDAILYAMEACGIHGSYNGSARTVDVSNADAVAFTQELVGKYMKYFADRGCTYFNIGADEYANDIYNSGSMGFGNLITANLYDEFIDYINQLVDMAVDTYGLRPIAFNDGIYFQSNTKFGTFDTRLIVSYWSGGWGDYSLATPSFLQSKNHLILNTSDLMYYVMGRISSGDYNYNAALSRAQSYDVDDTVSGAIGAMQCVWCDEPEAEYNTDEQGRVQNLIATLASTNSDVYTGPNVVNPAPEPEVPEDVGKTDTDTGIVVTAPGLTGLDVQKITENVPAVEGAKDVVAYSVAPATAEGSYTGEATVSIPVPAEWTNVRGGVLASEAGEAEMGIEGELKDDMFTFTVPHFSTVVAYELETAAEGDQDKITSTGGGVAYELATEFTAGGEYVIVNRSSDGTGYALTNNNGSATRTSVTVANGEITSLTEANDDNVLWTISGTSDATVLNNGYTLYLTRYYSFDLTEDDYTFTVSNQGNGAYRIHRYANNRYNYLTYSSNAWTKGSTSSINSIASVYLFQKVDTTAYTVNAALQQSRIIALTVENAGYTKETWTAYQNALTAANEKLTEVKGKTYTSETAANTALNELIEAVDALEAAKNALAKDVEITINYVDENEVTVKTETKTVAETATSVTLTSPIYSEAGNRYVLNNNVLPLDLANTTTYSVPVTEQAEDLDNVTPIKVEWWITNIKVDATDGTTHAGTITYAGGSGGNDQVVKYSEITAEAAYGENGVPVADYVPKTAEWEWSPDLYFWKGAHQTIDNYQTAQSGDMTGAGNDFYYVRYYQTKWWVSVDRTNWIEVDVDTVDVDHNDKLVAYYLQKQHVTDEVDVYFKDWGFAPGKYDGTNDGKKQVGLSVAVVYPDGTLSSTEDEIYLNSTVTFNYWANRDIGIVSPANNTIYEISKITVTNGTRSGTGVWSGTTNQVTWDKVTNEAGSQWYDERTVWSKETPDANDTAIPMVNGAASKDNVIWPSVNSAVLVLIYLDTVHYDTNLNVKWVDDSANGSLINEMEVAVTYEEGEEPVTFFNGLKQTSSVPTADGPLTLDDDAYVINVDKKEQTFNKDISVMPDVATQYRSGLYQYVGAEITDDGMTLILHYNIDSARLSPLYVVDFGLPVTFPFSEMVENPDELIKVNIDDCTYGVATVDMAKQEITFTPNKVLQNIAVVKITVTYNDGEKVTFRMGFVPATTVHYEASFLENENGWDQVNTSGATQTKELLVAGELKKVNNYGYQPGYTGGSESTASTIGATTGFTFTGTGVEIHANCLSNTGYVSVRIRNADTGKTYLVNTVAVDGSSNATTGQKTISNAPIVSVRDLPHGTYTVTITKVMDANPVQISGFRVFNTLSSSSMFEGDLEENPEFYELRDEVLFAANVSDTTSKDYGTVAQMSEQVYKVLSGDAAAVIVSPQYSDAYTAQDLLDKGPKNELLLHQGSTLIFNVKTARDVQVGLREVNGDTTYSITGATADEGEVTPVDMFYDMGVTPGTSQTYTFTITNTGSNILSVTLLKICDDPSAALAALTAGDIEKALYAMGYTDAEPETPTEPEIPSEPSVPSEPTEPEVPTEPSKPEETEPSEPVEPEKPAEPEVKQKDAKLKITYINLFGRKVGSATLTKTGTANQRCIFSVSEITENAPANKYAVWLLPVVTTYGSTTSIIVPVI